MTDRQTSLAAPHHDRIRRLLHHGTQPYTPRRPSRARPQLGAGEREASSEPGLETGASWPRPRRLVIVRHAQDLLARVLARQIRMIVLDVLLDVGDDLVVGLAVDVHSA